MFFLSKMLLLLLSLALSNTDLDFELLYDSTAIPFTRTSSSNFYEDATTYCVDVRLKRLGTGDVSTFYLQCAQYANATYVAEWKVLHNQLNHALKQPNTLPIEDYDHIKKVYHIGIAALTLVCIHIVLNVIIICAQRGAAQDAEEQEQYA
jgi:hypothetical protein